MLMRTVSGIDEDEDEPGGIEESASMRERRHSRRHEEFERRKERRMRASGRALWWMLAAQGTYLLLFLLADYVFDELGSAANYACNVATLAVTLLGLIAVRRAFRHNYSVTVLTRLWSKLPILLALLSTVAIVCVEAYLAVVAGCSFAAQRAHEVVENCRMWWVPFQALAQTISDAALVSTDAIVALPHPRARAALSLLLMISVCAEIYHGYFRIDPAVQAVIWPVEITIDGVRFERHIRLADIKNSCFTSLFTLMFAGTLSILRRPKNLAFLHIRFQLAALRKLEKDKHRDRELAAAKGGGGERFDRRPSLHLPRFSAAAPSERASAGAEGSEAPAAAPSPPRSGTRSGTRMRWRRNGGGDPEVARVDAARFTEADLD